MYRVEELASLTLSEQAEVGESPRGMIVVPSQGEKQFVLSGSFMQFVLNRAIFIHTVRPSFRLSSTRINRVDSCYASDNCIDVRT